MTKKAEIAVPTSVQSLMDMAGTVSAPGDVSEREYGGFRHGEWGYGRDHNEFDDDVELALNPYEFQHGLQYFPGGGGKPVGPMVPAAKPIPVPADVDEKNYQNCSVIPAVVLDGIDKGLEIDLKGHSYGWDKAFKKITRAVVRQAQADPDHVYPVVTLSTESYYNKKYSKDIANPIMTIVGWTNQDATSRVDA